MTAWPAVTPAVADLPIDRSALGWVVDTADAVLFAVVGSGVVEVTVAVLVTVPVAAALVAAVMVTVLGVAVVTVPSAQVTSCPTALHPAVPLVKVTPVGKVSVMVAPVAVDGPLLLTMRV